MKQSLFSIFICLLACSAAMGQAPRGLLLAQPGIIQEATISDSVLLQETGKFITRLEATDTMFKKYGYIRAMINRPDRSPAMSGKNICLEMTASYFYFYPDIEANRFPLYVTEINGRLVLIYDPLVHHQALSRKVRKRFSKKVNDRLPPLVIQKIKDENGKVRKLRPVGDISLGQATVLCR